MKKNVKTLIFSLVAVLAIIGVVVGGTFAYFQWTTGEDQKTSVNVTIEMGGITMHIEPEETEFVGLKPTAYCNRDAKYGDALVTIVNNTGTLAIPSFRLKAKVTKGGTGTLTQEMLSHINYTVIPLETTVDEDGKPVKGDDGEYDCALPLAGNEIYEASKGYELLFSNATEGAWETHLKFGSVATDGTWTHIPNIGDLVSEEVPLAAEYLPRQYFLSDPTTADLFVKGDVNGITFKAPQYETTYQYFRVYVWIDEGYSSITTGNTVSDPLQNAKIEIAWSEESIVQQVAA